MTDPNGYVTTRTFLELLHNEYCKKNQSGISLADFLKQGVSSDWTQKGDLEDVENTLQALPYLDHKNAARIVHEFLKKEYGEADEEDISPAKDLKDLYDCHTCVNHIAQVYVKGIMSARNGLFGTSDLLTIEEAVTVVGRMFSKEIRTPPKAYSGSQVRKLTLEEAMAYVSSNPRVVLIDVRSMREFEEDHLKGAIHISLPDILKNPYQVSADKFTPLLFYCENGYQSEIAANCVWEAGYPNVGYASIVCF